ncbi:Autophagy protein, partial [Lachnellula suecica]
MASWRDEYIQALHERDTRQKASYQQVDDQLIEAYTQLLDRTAALEAEKASRDPSTQETKPRDPGSPAPPTEATAHIRSDLAEALRSNGQLQSRIKIAEAELVKLRAKGKSEGKLIEELAKERASLAQKVKDRDEELRGKAKLLDDVHDEVISLNLELSMSEQSTKKLRAENKDLIDRWMVYKKKEAEAMNDILHGN